MQMEAHERPTRAIRAWASCRTASNGIEESSTVHRGPLKGVDMAKDDKTTKVKDIKGKGDKGNWRLRRPETKEAGKKEEWKREE